MLALALRTPILHRVSFVFGVERDYVNADLGILSLEFNFDWKCDVVEIQCLCTFCTRNTGCFSRDEDRSEGPTGNTSIVYNKYSQVFVLPSTYCRMYAIPKPHTHITACGIRNTIVTFTLLTVFHPVSCVISV